MKENTKKGDDFIFSNIKQILNFIYIPNMTIFNILEIIVLTIVFYKIVIHIKDSRGWMIIKGLIVLSIFYILCLIFNFYVISLLFEKGIYIVAFGLIIIFNTEIKKFLEQLGQKGFLKDLNIKNNFKSMPINNDEKNLKKSIHEIIKACKVMSKAKTGALILFQKNTNLNEYNETGIIINADISSQLIINIFEHNTPLHDGAMIINNNQIVSATCYLPLSDNNDINKSLGTRHRAGIGVSEATDCIVLIVSEETGGISICENGNIKKVTDSELEEELIKKLMTKNETLLDTIQPKKVLKHNLTKKILSFVFAIIVWFFIFNYEDPSITKTFTIPVSVTNETSLTSLDQTYSVKEGNETTIKVKGRNSELKKLTSKDFIAIADLSKLSYVYAVPIEVKCEKDVNVEINVIKNDTLKIEIDEITEYDCPIIFETEGKLAKGYNIKELTIASESLHLTGSKSKIKNLKACKLIVNIDNLNKDTIQNVEVQLIDKNNKVLKLSDFNLDQTSFDVNISLYPTKEIPIKITTIGKPNSNYQLKKYEWDKKIVEIAGEQTLLDKINELNVEVDISNIESNISKSIDLKNSLPNGIILTDNDNNVVSVKFELEEFKNKTFTINSSKLEIKNLNDNYTYEIDNTDLKIKISAIETVFNDLKIEDLNPYLDCSNLIDGDYNLKVQLPNQNNVTITEVDTAKIKIIKK